MVSPQLFPLQQQQQQQQRTSTVCVIYLHTHAHRVVSVVPECVAAAECLENDHHPPVSRARVCVRNGPSLYVGSENLLRRFRRHRKLVAVQHPLCGSSWIAHTLQLLSLRSAQKTHYHTCVVTIATDHLRLSSSAYRSSVRLLIGWNILITALIVGGSAWRMTELTWYHFLPAVGLAVGSFALNLSTLVY